MRLDKTCPKLEGLIAGNMKKGNGFAVGSKVRYRGYVKRFCCECYAINITGGQ